MFEFQRRFWMALCIAFYPTLFLAIARGHYLGAIVSACAMFMVWLLVWEPRFWKWLDG